MVHADLQPGIALFTALLSKAQSLIRAPPPDPMNPQQLQAPDAGEVEQWQVFLSFRRSATTRADQTGQRHLPFSCRTSCLIFPSSSLLPLHSARHSVRERTCLAVTNKVTSERASRWTGVKLKSGVSPLRKLDRPSCSLKSDGEHS